MYLLCTKTSFVWQWLHNIDKYSSKFYHLLGIEADTIISHGNEWQQMFNYKGFKKRCRIHREYAHKHKYTRSGRNSHLSLFVCRYQRIGPCSDSQRSKHDQSNRAVLSPDWNLKQTTDIMKKNWYGVSELPFF